MTVIAWDGVTLAADKLALSGSTKNSTTKIFRFGQQLLAVTGELSMGMHLLDWYQRGADPATWPTANNDPQGGASLIVITATGGVVKYESTPYPFHLEGSFQAFGAGSEAALVAMECGATAEQAIWAVSKWTTCGGIGVDCLQLQEARP